MKPTTYKRNASGKSIKMPCEDQNSIWEDINLNDIDIFDDAVDNLLPSQEDALLERARLKMSMHVVPTVPCECGDPFCDNWIDKTDLFWIIGWNNETIICMDCANPINKREDINE